MGTSDNIKTEWGQFNSRGTGGYLRLRYKSVRNKLIKKSYPVALHIEPFGGCNIRCQMCFQGRTNLPADKKSMDLDLYKKIIDEVSPYTTDLHLYWRGEPFMHPNLGTMIDYARDHDLYVIISTNATLLTKEKAQEIIDVGLDHLLVGLDGATKESYEMMRRGAKYETVVENIKTLIDLKKEQKSHLPHVRLQCIVSAVNQNELDEFRQLSTRLGADSHSEKALDIYENFGNQKINRDLQPLFVEGELSKYEKGDNGQLVSIDYAKCYMPRRIIIRADGELSLCCYDLQGEYPIGSSNDSNVMELWLNSSTTNLRKNGIDRQLPLCNNCGIGLEN